MLTDDKIFENFIRYKSLINQIQRSGFNKEQFLSMLESSDFRTAPASTKYHNSFSGGLCDHCLKVYDNLCKLVETKDYKVDDPDSLIILALFHDLAKINLYKKSAKNVKHYCTEVEYNADPKAYKQFDELGNFKWEAKLGWETIDFADRFVYGNHEETCEYIASMYIPLRREESVAILHHMGGMSYDSNPTVTYDIYRRYPLAMFLFIADFMASIIDEEIS